VGGVPASVLAGLRDRAAALAGGIRGFARRRTGGVCGLRARCALRASARFFSVASDKGDDYGGN